jgi:hypothetical protein
MKQFIVPMTAFVILLCVLCSGCTSESGTAPVTTAVPATAIATVSTTVPAVVATTAATVNEPVQSMPSAQQVNLDLTKDRPTSEIHLSYQGGPGDIFINTIMMRVYTSDTDYTEYVMSNGKKPIPGDEIVAPGTRGPDRCEVFVTSGGTRYKVMDKKVAVATY